MLALLGLVVHVAAAQSAGAWRLPPPGPLHAPIALPRPRLGDFTLTPRSAPRLEPPLRWDAESLLDRRFPAARADGDNEGQVLLGMVF